LPSLDLSFASFSLYQDKENEEFALIKFVYLFMFFVLKQRTKIQGQTKFPLHVMLNLFQHPQILK